MNFQKIRNYNQFLLAIVGTFGVLFFVIGGSAILINEMSFLFDDDDNYETGILAIEQAEELLADSLRQQIISFQNMELIDSAEKTYLLPVRQANLDESEPNTDLLNVIKSRGSRNYYPNHSTYNNLVLYESLKNKSEIIFHERIGINQYKVLEQNKNNFILITGALKDSNRDKYLNADDLQSLFIYKVQEKLLIPIFSKKGHTILQIIQDEKTKEIYGKYGVDRNENGKFQWGKEPVLFYKIDIPTTTLIPVLLNDQIIELQKLLEGN